MIAYIALLRGINVSGYNSIKMADLRQLLADSGLKNVITYIQSGNIIFNSKKTNSKDLEQLISTTIKKRYGYQIQVWVFNKEYLKQIFDWNPFNDEYDYKSICVTILKSIPLEENKAKVELLKTESESIIFKDKIAYLHCPNGYARTKLSNNNIESKLKVAATSRNWKTITKLVELSTTIE